jgi:hypothetical protein
MARVRAAEPEPEPVPRDKRLPVVRLVKADPPPLVKPTQPKLTELVRPLLEEILVSQDRDWFRVVLFFKDRQAAMNLKRLRDAHSRTAWQWEARRLSEVGQSAIYVRWVGTE